MNTKYKKSTKTDKDKRVCNKIIIRCLCTYIHRVILLFILSLNHNQLSAVINDTINSSCSITPLVTALSSTIPMLSVSSTSVINSLFTLDVCRGCISYKYDILFITQKIHVVYY